MPIDYKSIPLNGVVPSPHDPRDYTITRLVPKLNVFPDEFQIPYNHEIKNQVQINSCVAHSLSYVLEIDQEKKTKNYTKLSPGFVYGMREIGDYEGSGMYPRQALKEIKDFGICSWDVFPYNEEWPYIKTLVDQNKDKIIKDAESRKISAYAQVTTVDDIRSALMQLGPVTICFKICPSFYQINSSNPVFTPPSGTESILGYHEMTITSWKIYNGKPVFVVLNSWGKDWGNGNGYFYLPFSVLDTQSYYLVEAWSATDLPIQPQPNPDPVTHKYWRVQCGSFSIKSNADAYQQVLKTKGYNSYIVFINGLFKLQVGAFSVESNSRNLSAELKTKGINNFIVYY